MEIVYLILGFFAGLYSLFDGTKKYLLVQKINNTPTSKVHSAAIGLSEFYGQAYPIIDTSSPISKEKCVYWKIIVMAGRRRQQRRIYTAQSENQFYLNDRTGKIAVDPMSGQLEIPVDKTYTGVIDTSQKHMASFGKLDPKAVEWIKSLEGKAKELFSHNENTYLAIFEYYIADGDYIYVLGDVENKNEKMGLVGCENLIVKKGKNNVLYISDKDEKRIAGDFGFYSKLEVFGGLALSAVCLAILLIFLQSFLR